MGNLFNWIGDNAVLVAGYAGIICGVALFYLVMSRTIRRRDETADSES